MAKCPKPECHEPEAKGCAHRTPDGNCAEFCHDWTFPPYTFEEALRASWREIGRLRVEVTYLRGKQGAA
jgi:hypothetical protein